MTDSMNFGPEWLRNLSSSSGVDGGAPRYQLAEHRYGREEMLALFDKKGRAPDHMVKMQGLYVEKTQPPMALLSMTEEETRQWNKGINSDAVLRLSGKAPLGPPGGLRVRGGSVDRGRGRTRGTGGYHYTRGLSYDDSTEGMKGEGGLSERGFSRGIRTYDRSQGSERGWPERNGLTDPSDWNGSTSPRKEYGKEMGGRSGGGIDNWRRHRVNSDEEEGWRRTEKWTRSNSWREESDGTEGQGGGGGVKTSSGRSSNWGRGWADEGLRGRHEEGSVSGRRPFVDEVPEWAMENPMEAGGSFDATGAFHGGQYSDEEEEDRGSPGPSREPRPRLMSDDDPRSKPRSPPRPKRPSRIGMEGEPCEEEPRKPVELSRSHTAQGSLATGDGRTTQPPLSKSQSTAAMKSDSFDRIRVQHQNFVDKVSGTKGGAGVETRDNIIVEGCVEREALETDRRAKVQQDRLSTTGSSLGKSSVGGSGRDSHPAAGHVNRQGSEEDMDRMAEVVKDSVVKLIEDEDRLPADEKWFYRDPQGVVQGPFPATEMLEWFKTGYFQDSLLVRRETDERYSTLGELKNKFGNVPFRSAMTQDVAPPPQPTTQTQPPSDVHQLVLSHQLALNNQTQKDAWSSLTPVQQLLMRRALFQQMAQPMAVDQFSLINKNLMNVPSQLGTPMQNTAQPVTEGNHDAAASINHFPHLLLQMLAQQQLPQQGLPGVPVSAVPGVPGVPGILPHQLAQTASNVNPIHGNVPPPMGVVPENKPDDAFQNLLRQLSASQTNLPQPPPVDSVWGAVAPSGPPPGRGPGWTAAAVSTEPAINMLTTMPLWSEIKTEQQILVEQQQHKMQHQLKLEEEQRKEQEARRAVEEEKQKRKEMELRREEEARAKEELKKLEQQRLEEEMRVQKEIEEKRKADELKRKREDALRKKQEELKRLEEAQKKKEEKERRKEEERERKRLHEEEKKRVEEELQKRDQELALKKAEEDQEAGLRRAEQHRREAEALKQLREQNMKTRMAPWSQQTTLAGTSLADIQKLQEKEKKQQQLVRDQQQVMAHIAHQNELAQIQREMDSRTNGLNLKWAEHLPRSNHSVKSLAEIQAEEQMNVSKQQERERLERSQQIRETAGIWGAASQSLSWSNNNADGAPWSQATPASQGFWEEAKPMAALSPAKTNKQANSWTNQQTKPTTGTGQKGSKPKSKKEEAAVMKLFERLGDEFTVWCTQALQSLEADVDIPTFVGFLRDIDSPFDVKDYVKHYLGEGKNAQEFAKEFLERRSRWRSAQKNCVEDDMCVPAHSVNPGPGTQEFQEVKGKGKKSKKGKMLKVDSRILGFSVTAAPDRINIGGRDYVDNNL